MSIKGVIENLTQGSVHEREPAEFPFSVFLRCQPHMSVKLIEIFLKPKSDREWFRKVVERPHKSKGREIFFVCALCQWRTLNLKLKVRIPGEKKSPAGESWDFSSFLSRQRRDWRNCREISQRGIKETHWKYCVWSYSALCFPFTKKKQPRHTTV